MRRYSAMSERWKDRVLIGLGVFSLVLSCAGWLPQLSRPAYIEIISAYFVVVSVWALYWAIRRAQD